MSSKWKPKVPLLHALFADGNLHQEHKRRDNDYYVLRMTSGRGSGDVFGYLGTHGEAVGPRPVAIIFRSRAQLDNATLVYQSLKLKRKPL